MQLRAECFLCVCLGDSLVQSSRSSRPGELYEHTLWLRAGVWMELILPGGQQEALCSPGKCLGAALGSVGSVQPGWFHV